VRANCSNHSASYWRDRHCSVAELQAKSLPLGGERPHTRLMRVQCGPTFQRYELHVESAEVCVLDPVFVLLQHTSCCTSPACCSRVNRSSQVNTFSLSNSCFFRAIVRSLVFCSSPYHGFASDKRKSILARLISLCMFNITNRRQSPLHFV
jgi:hypothetical protein